MRSPSKHLQELFKAMVNKSNVVRIGENDMKDTTIIQSINLDGECTLFNTRFNEIMEYDVPCKYIRVVK